MKSFFEIPKSEDEVDQERPKRRTQSIKFAIAAFVGVAVAGSLAATITISAGESFEFGQRSYDVGTCADTSVQMIPKTEGTPTRFTQLTVVGISPIACNNRVIRLSTYETGSPETLLRTFAVYVRNGEFLAVDNGANSSETAPLLRQANGSETILSSTFSAGAGGTAKLYSGGGGKTLRSLEDALDQAAISFQIRLDPGINITNSYSRTSIVIEVAP